MFFSHLKKVQPRCFCLLPLPYVSASFRAYSFLRSALKMTSFDDLKATEIDPSGTFKYILIEASNGEGKKKMLVRGNARGEYHNNIFDECEKTVDKSVKLNCKGGGKLNHDSKAKKINVYGESQGYGKADHKQSVELIKSAYPDYTVTNDEEKK